MSLQVAQDVAARKDSLDSSIDEVLQTKMTLYRRVVPFHYVGDAPAAESRHGWFLLDASRSSYLQVELMDERKPQTAEICPYKKPIQPQQDEYKGDSLAYLGRQSSRAVGIMSDPPDYGTQHASHIQRVAGNHVKNG